MGAPYGHLGGVLGCPGASSGRLGSVCFSYHLPWDSMANRFWPCLLWNSMVNAGQAIPQHIVYQFAMETAPAMDCHGISMANLSKIISFQLLGPTCVCHGIPWQTGPTPTGQQTDPFFTPPARKKRSKRKKLSLGNKATSIGLRPLSVNRGFSVIWPSDFPPAASRTLKKHGKMQVSGPRPPKHLG